MQVDVPMTLTTSPRRMLAPMASQWASNAPVGMGMPASQTKDAGPLFRQVAGDLVGGFIATRDLVAYAGEERVNGGQKLFRRQPSPLRVPHPLVARMAQMLRGISLGSVMPQSVAATMSQCLFERGDKLRAELRVVAEPVKQRSTGPTPTSRRRHRTSRCLRSRCLRERSARQR